MSWKLLHVRKSSDLDRRLWGSVLISESSEGFPYLFCLLSYASFPDVSQLVCVLLHQRFLRSP